MGKPTGFKEFPRKTEPYRDAAKRLLDFDEIYTAHDAKHLAVQGARCMDCGVPFCQSTDGCPIYNLIPEWNDLVYRGRWREALDRLHQTNNFPEFTGRVCPAPCEGACVLGITDPAVTIKNIEMAIIDRGFDEGWVVATSAGESHRQARRHHRLRSRRSCRRGAAESGGPSRHRVRARRPHRRPADVRHSEHEARQSAWSIAASICCARKASTFMSSTPVGDGSEWFARRARAARRRTTPCCSPPARPWRATCRFPDANCQGIHFAMEFLRANTKSLLDSNHADGNYISAKDKDVIVIGGGDTGTDCIGTSLRHGCRSLVNFEMLPQPPAGARRRQSVADLAEDLPRRLRPRRGSEALRRRPARVQHFGQVVRRQRRPPHRHAHDRGRSSSATSCEEIPNTEKVWKADLILIAMGFLGPEHHASDALGIAYDPRSNLRADYGKYATNVPKVFAAGDCRRGQSLVVRAINEGREAAREIDRTSDGRNAAALTVRNALNRASTAPTQTSGPTVLTRPTLAASDAAADVRFCARRVAAVRNHIPRHAVALRLERRELLLSSLLAHELIALVAARRREQLQREVLCRLIANPLRRFGIANGRTRGRCGLLLDAYRLLR